MHTTFHPHIVRAFLLASATLLAAGAAAAPRFLPGQAGDLVPQKIAAPGAALKSAGAPGLSREAVGMSWAAQGSVTTAVQSFIGQSREYYAEVSAEELAVGVAIHTTAPRALVRLQALGARGKQAIHPQALVISDAGGRAFAAGSGMDMLVTADKLSKAELPFAEGTSAFRLHPDLGTGTFKLRAADAQAGERYMVNVVEPGSRFALTMQTDAPSYLHGQQLSVLPELQEQDGAVVNQRHVFRRLDGVVVSPAGRSFPVSFKVDKDGRLRARLPLDADEAPAPGLWEVQASGDAMVKGQTVKRSLRVAFGVAMPVARLDGSASVVNEPGSVGVRLGVEVAAAGRYETRALLYGTVGGALKPLAVAHAAHWLEPGSQALVLRYDAALLAGASGPYELRDLTLLDQGRMGVLQRQRRGVSIDERDLARTGAQMATAKPAERPKLPPVNN
ncbi:MAG: DUF4785 domain-containing protein [Pseudomonadota bacterium]